MAENLPEPTELKYSIFKYSSYSTKYAPQGILEDCPGDQTSRWSTDSTEFPQFIVLKLEKPSIVRTITFGKYERSHACNVKKFCIYGGLTDDSMVLLLESGLKNSPISETFSLRHTVANKHFPIRFLKIMPLQAHGGPFNFSIWYVMLKGCQDWNIVKNYINWYAVYREREAIRLCLKHFRRHNYVEAYESLCEQSQVELEHPVLTDLHSSLVKNGDFDTCEKLISQAANEGLFEEYVCSLDYKPKWTPIFSTPGMPKKEKPGMRGGHQMCIDTNYQMIYLFGGWDGTQDLSDLWSYHIPSQEWNCISRDTHQEGGPSGRSCHKMCLDAKRREIFTLGRYLDSTLRKPENLKSDFYLYDIEKNKWTQVTDDTAAIGGPRLVFDHQMAMDTDSRIIYVFGGKVLTFSRWEGCANSLSDSTNAVANFIPSEPIFSGLYSYHVATNTWTLLREDSATPSPSSTKIKSRIGHSMLYHTANRQLYILAGQRQKEFLTDFFTYNIDTDSISFISDGSRKDASSVPSAGFTQKATIDPNLNEIHVLAGLSKDKDRKDDNVRNSFWVYDITQNKWSCIYHNEQMDENYWTKMQHLEPCPRFAHQLVYDDVNKAHYLFGGNPGKASLPKMRLDDFWSLQLSKLTTKQLLKSCIFNIRKAKYKELAQSDAVSALQYLQTTLYSSVDHRNSEQVEEFQHLASTLFQTPDPVSLFVSTPGLHLAKDFLEDHNFPIESGTEPEPMEDTDEPDSSNMSEESDRRNKSRLSKTQLAAWQHQSRSELFDTFTQYFPELMSQPRSNLVDFIP